MFWTVVNFVWRHKVPWYSQYVVSLNFTNIVGNFPVYRMARYKKLYLVALS